MTAEESIDLRKAGSTKKGATTMGKAERDEKRLARRQFLKGAAAGVVGAAAGGVLAGCGAEPTPGPAPTPQVIEKEVIKEVEVRPWLPARWDKEADVVVVGFGGAGAVAAIVAKDAGAKVLILEKDAPDKHYPSTMMSGGSLHYAKDPADAATYFRTMAFGVDLPPELGDPAQAYPVYPESLIEDIAQAWGTGVCETADWLQSLGPVNITVSVPKKSFPTFPGGEQYGTASVAAEVGVLAKSGGQTLYKHLADAVENREIEVLWEMPGKRLIVSGTGEIVGVIAEQGGAEVAVKANRGVILTTGGFEYDEELRKMFLPGWKWSFLGSPSATGDGVRMAMGAGAALRRMHHAVGRSTAGAMLGDIGTGMNIKANDIGRILVDNYGVRFVNEDWTSVDPPRYFFNPLLTQFDPAKMEYPRLPSWVIFDETQRQAGPVASTTYGAHAVGLYEWSQDNSREIEKGWILKGDSIEHLAAKIAAHPENKGRMDAATLKATIEKMNGFAQAGEDSEFGRSGKSLAPIETAPFYATAMYPGAFLGGGPLRNAEAQVMSIFSQPIPRLYSAGELGSWVSFVYTTGAFLAECVISGRIAGANAAEEKPWE